MRAGSSDHSVRVASEPMTCVKKGGSFRVREVFIDGADYITRIAEHAVSRNW